MEHLIIDTDGGVDDSLALFYACASSETDIAAITTVHGNVPLDVATRNVFEVLRLLGRTITVARGCARPLAEEPYVAHDVHGNHGLGGWMTGREDPHVDLATATAPQLILDLAEQRPGELTVVTIGPLTNLAIALLTDPIAFAKLKRVVIMGGAVWHPGNVTAASEFNIYVDPLAARLVLRSGLPCTLVGLDVTTQVALTRDRLDRELASRDDEKAAFLRCICEQVFSFYRARAGKDIVNLHDPLAIGVALDKTLVTTNRLRVNIEVDGELTRGMTVGDRRSWVEPSSSIEVCAQVDSERFLSEFCSRVFRFAASAGTNSTTL